MNLSNIKEFLEDKAAVLKNTGICSCPDCSSVDDDQYCCMTCSDVSETSEGELSAYGVVSAIINQEMHDDLLEYINEMYYRDSPIMVFEKPETYGLKNHDKIYICDEDYFQIDVSTLIEEAQKIMKK